MSTATGRSGRVRVWIACLVVSFPLGAFGADPPHYVKKGTWYETMLASRELLMQAKGAVGLPDLGASDFALTAWVRTEAAGGTILAKAPTTGDWAPQGKVLFLRGGALAFDVGWVGAVTTKATLNDGAWHHVGFVGRDPLEFYVDGKLVGRGSLELKPDPPGFVATMGYCTPNFPGPSGFEGSIDEVRIYRRRLSPEEVDRIRAGGAVQDGGLAGHWQFENGAADSSGNGHDGTVRGCTTTEGRSGTAILFNGRGAILLPASAIDAARNELWGLLARDFPDRQAREEMERERKDGLWGQDWPAGNYRDLAARYVEACLEAEQRAAVARLAENASTVENLWKVRAGYHAPPPIRWPEPTPLDTDRHLVAWWKFDEQSGTSVQDSSPKGHHGALLVGGLSLEAASVRGRFGYALKFDGKGGLVEITGYKGIAGARPRTVSAWIMTTSSGGEIVSWGADDFGRMWTFGFVRGRVGVTPNGGYLYMNDAIHNGAWHHVAVAIEEAEAPNLHDDVKLYLDGKPAEIHDIGLLDLWPIDTGDELDVRVGRGFNGCIDDIRIYERALSTEEVKILFDVKTRTQ